MSLSEKWEIYREARFSDKTPGQVEQMVQAAFYAGAAAVAEDYSI